MSLSEETVSTFAIVASPFVQTLTAICTVAFLSPWTDSYAQFQGLRGPLRMVFLRCSGFHLSLPSLWKGHLPDTSPCVRTVH